MSIKDEVKEEFDKVDINLATEGELIDFVIKITQSKIMERINKCFKRPRTLHATHGALEMIIVSRLREIINELENENNEKEI